MLGISVIHRRLAEIVLMSTDQHGNMFIGGAELKQIMPLLRQNLLLVQQLDSLKSLAFHAYEMGDHDWHMEICAKIDELEASMV